MLYWDKFKHHDAEVTGKRRKYDATIYSFDIETTSYYVLYGKQYKALKYLKLSDKEKKDSIPMCHMYIWMFGINDTVYYGRTWSEFKEFLKRLNEDVPVLKYVFVHNLAFEFQFLKSIMDFDEVSARKSHKVMTALSSEFNIMFKCSYMMSNCALKYLPELFKLPVEKMVGDLDYSLDRTSITPLSKKELGYCENDCLVVYHYILNELKTYEDVRHIPTTSTGKVRRELQNLVRTDFRYRRIVGRAINTDPHVYNLLQDAFMGGYTHANWIYTDEIINDVDSFDETSAYPYVLVTCKFPSSEFRKCYINKRSEMSNRLCYLLRVKFTNIKCKYFNNFISESKCRNIRGAKYDNGRIIEATELEITLTDIDFYLILDTYTCQYEILECYFATYNYLPKQFINFVLDKYENKTKYKDDPEHELDYQKEKNKFNSLYGMSVTNTIRDNVIFDNEFKVWNEVELTNDEIIEKLNYEKKKAFLSFAYGVWVTAYARNNLIRRIIDLDDYVLYADTDSIKLKQGYDINVINKYNDSVRKRIEFVSSILHIDVSRYAPEDIHGEIHMLGLFESETKKHQEHTYKEFITQGAKKYAYMSADLNKKTGEIKDKLHITVAGVPKDGAKALKSLDDFKDDFIFDFEYTNKNLLFYTENQFKFEFTDYLGFKYIVSDKSGCCLLPTTYELSKSLDYVNLISDSSSKRARFKEEL